MKYFLIFLSLFTACAHQQTSPTSDKLALEDKYAHGDKIVLVTHPSCGFSQRAFANFSPKINTYIKQNGIILAPVNKLYEENHFTPIQEWNASSEYQHIAVYNNTSLKNIDLKGTPKFYFFKDGVLQKTITGWPKNNSRISELESAIDMMEKAKK
jgi:hypothetical protein